MRLLTAAVLGIAAGFSFIFLLMALASGEVGLAILFAGLGVLASWLLTKLMPDESKRDVSL